MEVGFAHEIFFVLLAALAGGLIVRLLKIQPLVGYILAGVVFGSILPIKTGQIEKLAEVGAILLLFSTGIELSLKKLAKVVKVAVIGGIIQILAVTAISYFLLLGFGFSGLAAAIMAAGFSISSTAVVIKILLDRGEEDTLHGEIMIGWSLVQDLAVIPMMILLTALANPSGGIILVSGLALLKALSVVVLTLILGRLVAPYFIHKIASINSRELLVLSSITLALGTAALTSYFGVSPALGAFLAGVVISESQENHAIFAEMRPLRDIFVALFFVSLGFLVTPSIILTNFGLIILLAVVVFLVKFVTVFIISLAFRYHGRTATIVSFGLAQVGEFAFILFSLGMALGVFPKEAASIGIATALLTLIATPFLFKSITPIWKSLRNASSKVDFLRKIILGGDRVTPEGREQYSNHIIICGFGRVGGWVGRALGEAKIPFVVVDYNQSVVSRLKAKGIQAIYGDPTEKEVIEAAGAREAKAVILAIPDEFAQEEIVAHIENLNPRAKVIARVHKDEDFEKLKLLKVNTLIQPEFEGAIRIIRTIFVSMGRPKDEINERIKNIRLSHAAI